MLVNAENSHFKSYTNVHKLIALSGQKIEILFTQVHILVLPKRNASPILCFSTEVQFIRF